MGSVESLNTVWFALIGLLWTGYFVLEGFDFGVGMLARFLGRDDIERRVAMNAIGPTWDGNEVWLLVAGGATFAAFPTWYASVFSGFYLALFLILAALIVRGVTFEFRSKRPSRRWRETWDWGLAVGSLIPAILWGVAFVDLLHGVSLDASGEVTGGFGGLLAPVALLGGLASLAVFLTHGATFLALKTTGDLSARARRAAMRFGVPAALLVAGTALWLAADTRSNPGGLPAAVPAVFVALAVAVILVGVLFVRRAAFGRAFALTASAIVLLGAGVFSALFPRVVTSSGPGPSLTIWSAASAHETLLVMTIVAAIFTPFVLAYQGWTYWVFRQRLTRPPSTPEDLASRSPSSGPSPTPQTT
jgi:cytochrome d ubiquinol oxidase subunit II